MRFDKLEFDQPENRPVSAAPEAHVDKDEKYWYKLADENRRTGNYETALRFYSRALEMDKTLVVAWVGQVQMLVQLREYPQASLWSQKALELFPANGELMAGQAQAECRLGNSKKAHRTKRRRVATTWRVRLSLASSR